VKLDPVNRPVFVTCVLGILLYAGFYILDVTIYPQFLHIILPIRIGVIFWSLFCLYLFFQLSDDKLGLFAFLYMIPIAFGISFMCYAVGEGFGSVYYVGVLLAIIGSAMFARLKPIVYAGLMISILAQHFLLQFLLPFAWQDFMLNVFFMGASVLLSIAIFLDVLFKTQSKLYMAATTDPLTDLFNRRKLMELMQQERVRSQRTGRPYIIVIGDIDDFKEINDVYGHDEGDLFLTAVAGILKMSTRAQDYVGRWGGEEFLMILPETDLSGARLGIERVRRCLESTPVELSAGPQKVTMTFGLASSEHSSEIDEIVRLADEALYLGKHGTKNCVVVYSNESAGPGVDDGKVQGIG